MMLPSMNRVKPLFATALCSSLLAGLFCALPPAPAAAQPYQWDDSMKGTVVSGLSYPNLVTDKESQRLRFVAFGDSGTGSVEQWKLAGQMEHLNKFYPFSLMLMLGDNIYPNGGQFYKYGAKRFREPYLNLYKGGVRLMPVLGDRDVALGYSKPMLDYYGMPASYYDYTVGPVHFFAIDTNAFDNTQKEWLRERLDQSISPWKVVYGHHPVFSSSGLGGSPAMQKHLKPSLEIYGADLYLSSHNTGYERFREVEHVNYLVTGGGGAPLEKFAAEPQPQSVKRLQMHHFVVFDVTPKALSYAVVDEKGNMVDKGILQKEEANAVKP
ncbi:MAG: metallophosphoesterase [Cyanobacteria bacterium HKST-UBA04]|nr:metallophosphoesterase [Cyanobacteria bacterium HKST-UBA04]MCA9842873.1 metallophosphoesterase [Cyanobacteria bacterium HKST-UBA03]